MVIATVITLKGYGSDERLPTRLLRIHLIDYSFEEDRRTSTYSRLDLSRGEEETMIRWVLFPQKSNEFWWKRYRKYQEEMRR
jgi:hypothetical protein